jgi:hypothetical protein
MTADPTKAAAELADVLARENAALQRLDFPAVVSLLPAKEAAFAELAKREIQQLPPEAAVLGRRLMTLASENRTLLERAITVQTRIVGIVAQVARQEKHKSYSPKGQRLQPARPPAMTLSARA